MNTAGEQFLRDTVMRFRQEYLPRLEQAIGALAPEDLWWRPHDGVTSVGMLLTHLEGNVRQWILSGLGGEPDRRERDREFQPGDEKDARVLLERLKKTTLLACHQLDATDHGRLTEIVEIQGFKMSVLSAVYHVLEHFGWHTGQITWIAKARGGPDHGIAYYEDEALNEARNPE